MGEQDSQVVATLLAAAGLPADAAEVDDLARTYRSLRAAVDRLYEIGPDVLPATVYRCAPGEG